MSWRSNLNLLKVSFLLFPYGSLWHRCLLLNYYNAYAHGVVYKNSIVTLFVFNVQRCAQCLSLLPKSRGDEESWLVMIQKILGSINYNLNDAFVGLEEGIFNYIVLFFVGPGRKPTLVNMYLETKLY